MPREARLTLKPPPRHLTVAHPSPQERGVNGLGYRIFHFSFFTFPFSRRQPFFTFLLFYPFTFKSLWSTPHIIFSRSEAK